MDHIAGGVLFQLYPLPRKKAATLICYKAGSERMRVTFKGDLKAAEKKCKELAKSVTSGDAAIHLTPLDNRVWLEVKAMAAQIGRAPDSIMRDYLDAAKVLNGRATVLEVAREYDRRHLSSLPKATINQVVTELLEFLAGKKRDKSTLKAYRIPLGRLAEALDSNIADVTTAQLETALFFYNGAAPRTVNNAIAAYKRLFNYAIGKYLPRNEPTVADALAAVTDDRKNTPVDIFQPWELAALLQHAHKRVRHLIYLGAFAGLRTIELHRLDWSAIHLRPSKAHPFGHIVVAGNIAKQHRTASRRVIPIQENLAAWLADTKDKTGKVSTYCSEEMISQAITNVINAVNRERKKHGLPLLSRPKNGCRHSYGSYRLPVINSVDLLSIEMNNSPDEITNSYHELIDPDRLPEYWGIRPDHGDKVVSLGSAVA